MILNQSFNVTIPVREAAFLCDSAPIQAHYQSLLAQWWGAFLLGGFVLGFLACYIAMGWIAARQEKNL